MPNQPLQNESAGTILILTGVIASFLFVNPISKGVTGQENRERFRFDFGPGNVAENYDQILPATNYTPERGYGFEPGSAVEAIDRGGKNVLRNDFVTSSQPFFFSVKLPEGNYRVTMTFGDADEVSNATVKAELRRLMLEKVHTSIGEFATRSIVVNIRTPRIGGDGLVRLKDRERTSEAAAWDDKLTLEFNGDRPCLCAMEIERADDIPTVFLLGDSTVCDQPNEPWNSWGQMLTRFFKPQVAVANHAESGESLRSSLGAGRFRKVWSEAKPGDYLFIQFGHNDMKSRDSDALEQYKNQLKAVVREAKKRGVTAVLITSMERKSGVEQVTLGDYPATVRDVAVEGEATMIDLHAMSKILYRTLGPDLGKAFQDGTHHVAYGSYQLAKCVVQGIIDNKLELADFIVDDFSGYNPAHPDPVDGFDIPASPISSVVKPLGN